MIRYCVIVVVLMILTYSHSTNAKSKFIGWANIDIVRRELKKDAPLFGSIGEAIGKSIYWKRRDILCDVLRNREKQLICDEIMKHMIFRESAYDVRSFSDISPSPPVPDLADPSDPYKRVNIPIVDFGFSKRMFWCRRRKYNVAGGGSDSGENDGFFCGGSPCCKNHVFAFIRSEENKKKVIPQALMYDVDLLKNKGPACFGCCPTSASSAQPHCSHGSSALSHGSHESPAQSSRSSVQGSPDLNDPYSDGEATPYFSTCESCRRLHESSSHESSSHESSSHESSSHESSAQGSPDLKAPYSDGEATPYFSTKIEFPKD